MQSARKRAWKKLEEDTTTATMNRNVKTLPSRVRVAGGTSTGASKKKGKQTAQPATTDNLTTQNVSFKGLNGAKCRKWWQEKHDNHMVKTSIRKSHRLNGQYRCLYFAFETMKGSCAQ